MPRRRCQRREQLIRTQMCKRKVSNTLWTHIVESKYDCLLSAYRFQPFPCCLLSSLTLSSHRPTRPIHNRFSLFVVSLTIIFLCLLLLRFFFLFYSTNSVTATKRFRTVNSQFGRSAQPQLNSCSVQTNNSHRGEFGLFFCFVFEIVSFGVRFD